MANVIEMKFPRMMDRGTIFADLFGGKWCGALCSMMNGNGKNVCGAVGKPDAGAGKSDLHHFTREVAGLVRHVLVGSRDTAAGRVVIRAEMRGHATALCGRHKGQ